MNTLVFFIVLIICYLPFCVVLTLYGLSINDKEGEWEFAFTVVFMNSSINPFLYCWRLRELRAAVVKTARQMLCKQTEQNQTEFFLNKTQYKRVTARNKFSFFYPGVCLLCSSYCYGELEVYETYGKSWSQFLQLTPVNRAEPRQCDVVWLG